MRPSWTRAAFLLLAPVGAAGCAKGAVGTVVVSPANAAPGETAFGTGTSVSGGNKTLGFVSDSVVVAAASDPRGPSEASEPDFVWQIRGGVLELCERADDGREDCRYSTYTGFAPPPLTTFLPTIIEPGNLAGGTQLLILGQRNSVAAANVARHVTESVPFVEDKGIWVTASTPAIVGAQPVFLCSARPNGPECIALPFVAQRLLGSVVITRGTSHVPVLWMHAAQNTSGVLGVTIVDEGVVRCEDRAGTPQCEKAKEIEQ